MDKKEQENKNRKLEEEKKKKREKLAEQRKELETLARLKIKYEGNGKSN